MSSLFHYTSNQGAIGILQSSLLFATHYQYLNDPNELSQAADLIIPLFEKEFREEYQKYIKSGHLNSNVLKEFGDHTYLKEARTLFDVAKRVTNSTTPIFLTSFCRHEENSDQYVDGLLSQWRGYGSLGGCALEFDEEKLKELIIREAEEYAFSHISLRDIKYDRYQETLDLKEIEGVATAITRHMIERSKESEILYNERMHKMYNTIAITLPTLKSIGFREEREVRIIAPYMRKEAAAEYPLRAQKEIHFRYRNGQPVPYIHLFDNTGTLPIKRIIVGPQRDQSKVAYAIELALEGRGMGVEVARSNISYIP
ncbi:DUF2971 domain-containing protein [Microvirga sp. CF3062]|uniref:DUF2971 domain-containing protein n=1 Tax=Microvirga sp. CF3062 TaxID=3110182 RepID=UPI002E79895D|nr:DUF2971 domain-containing protein [Microvirga sp. CF3062]MEE1656659.1 DUF2971 domain-containing protein [Microvirga sp. CF3062]